MCLYTIVQWIWTINSQWFILKSSHIKCYLNFASSKHRYLTWLLAIYYLKFNFFVLPCLQWDPISYILFENLYMNAIWQSPSWKLRVSWLNNIFSALCGTWRFNCEFVCPVLFLVWGQINLVYILICSIFQALIRSITYK